MDPIAVRVHGFDAVAVSVRGFRWAAIGASSLFLAIPCLATPDLRSTGDVANLAAPSAPSAPSPLVTPEAPALVQLVPPETPALVQLVPPEAPALDDSHSDVVFDDDGSASIALESPLDAPAGHRILVPQVEITDGALLGLSSALSLAAPAGSPFAPDPPTVARDASLDRGWRQVGNDIIRWTSTGALVALVCLALACFAPGVRRRIPFFPSGPPLPAHQP